MGQKQGLRSLFLYSLIFQFYYKLITMEPSLKSEQYYGDLYDRHTVDRCRNLIRIHTSVSDRQATLINGKKPSKEFVDSVSKGALMWSLAFETGGRYLHKKETIERWMTDDKEKDRFYESVQVPKDIRCLKCGSLMKVKHKDLWTELNKPNRVLFMFACKNDCLPRRTLYDNGEEFKPTYPLSDTDEVESVTIKEEDPDLNYETDRARFCLLKEEGEKWQHELDTMEWMKKFVEEQKERNKNKEFYDKVEKINKLTIINLEKLLTPILEKEGYVKFQLSNPEITKDVIIPFGVYDSKSERLKHISEYELKHLLRKSLEGTNWRLMSEGVSYRLGYLSGRLRGYEREEDLLGLVK